MRSISGITGVSLTAEDNELLMKQIAHVSLGVARSWSKATANTEHKRYTANNKKNSLLYSDFILNIASCAPLGLLYESLSQVRYKLSWLIRDCQAKMHLDEKASHFY
jgi:hypothetical protein